MDWLEKLDQGALHWFQSEHAPWLDPVMANLTDLGQRYVVTLAALVALVVFLVLRRLRAAVLLLVATAASWGLVEGVKRVVQRPRPPKEEVKRVEPGVLSRSLPQPSKGEVSYSFPSGHALTAAGIYLTLALLAARRLRRGGLRVLVVLGTALLVVAIGVTRLYLGVHYVSDVVAGWLGGLGIALVCAWLDGWWAAPFETLPSAPPGPIGPA
jgi:undecaprenyl-diphosphatase